MQKIIETKLFTSDLIIYSDIYNSIFESEMIPLIANRVRKYSSFDPSIITELNNSYYKFEDKKKYLKEFILEDKYLLNKFTQEGLDLDDMIEIASYDGKNLDMTSYLKGYALSMLSEALTVSNSRYLINFGGDIIAENVDNIKIEYGPNNKMKRKLSGSFCFFSSGNYDEKRGNHIIQNNNYILGASLYCSKLLPIKCDTYCTQLVADNEFRIWNEDCNYFEPTKFLRNGLIC